VSQTNDVDWSGSIDCAKGRAPPSTTTKRYCPQRQKKMEITLQGVDPRWFNLIASLMAEILQFAGAFTLGAFLHLVVSLFLRRPGNQIPAKALGPLPDGLLAAVQFAQNMKWAWPATLALFLFVSDYSTVIAFAGLDFELVDQEGAQAPVLDLGQRNGEFPYAAIGDPLLPFTSSKLELLMGQAISSWPPQDEILQLADEESMVASFLGAADAIARGESVFLEQNEELVSDPTLLVVGRTENDGTTFFGNLTDSTVIFGGGSFLAAINHEIPLTCSDDVMSAIEEQTNQDGWMTSFEEHHGPDYWATKSRVPNCTFTSPRTSGIHGGRRLNRSLEITGYARVGSGVDAKLQTRSQGPVDDGSTFVFPYEGLYLARELSNFREGRRVFGFEGVQIGEVHIPFEETVVSSGSSLADPPPALDPTDQNTLRTREYMLISSVRDAMENCPSDPSGSEESVCMVTAKITCETFGSELGYGGFLNGYGGASGEGTGVVDLQHRCVFDGDIELIWGVNYMVDLQLLAAVAGVHSRNVGWASSLLQKRALTIHSIPSALFLLGTLRSRASIEQVRSTTINSIFIIFMCVPACLCVITGCVYLIGRQYLLPLPSDGPAAMELGAKVAQQQETQATVIPLKVVLSRPFEWNGACFVSDMGRESIIDELEDFVEDGGELPRGVSVDHGVSTQRTPRTMGEPSKVTLGRDDTSDQSVGKRTLHLTRAGTFDDSAGRRTVIYVVGCMVFCIALAILASGFIKAKNVGSDILQNLLPEETLASPSETQDQVEQRVPHHCFVDSNHLRTALLAHLHGSPEEQTNIIEKHGAFEDWCVDFVDDMSFMFADIPKAHLLNASGWNVSGVTKFSFCFYSYDFSKNVFDISKWDVSNGIYFHGMFSRAKRVGSDLSKWNVSSGISFNSMFHRSSVTSDISLWDVSSANNLNGMFAQTSFSPDLSQWDVSSVTDFSGMFQGATFNSNISQWDVSSGNDFSGMFRKSSFNSDISQWDVSSGTDFSRMFQGSSFNSDISKWDVSFGTDFSRMFYFARSFNTDISQWDVSSGTDFSGMFEGATFNSIISQWDVSSGMDFSRMFHEARSFNTDISQWDVSSGMDFSNMFSRAGFFNSNLSQWDVSSGTDFSSMFGSSSYFNSDISNWNVSSGIDFNNMFSSARSFNSDISQWDVSSGTDFSSMFSDATGFNGDISNWDVSKGTNFGGMFKNAESFLTDISQWDVSSGTDFNSMFQSRTFNSNISQWDVSSGTNFGGMFNYASSFNADISQWDVSSGTIFHDMFRLASSFNADLSKWDVSSAEDFLFMFEGATSFNGDISNWDVSSCTDFSFMFVQAEQFNVDLSEWDVSSGIHFSHMFFGAASFSSDISQWDVSSGTDLSYMFASASSFNPNISTWDVSSVTNFRGMFSNAYSFNVDLSPWDVSSGTDFNGMFYSASIFNTNLCGWQVMEGADTLDMFRSSGCPYHDLTEETICQICAPTALPSISPSANPTISPSPTISLTPTISPTISPSPTTACVDIVGWVDSFGEGCEPYVEYGCGGADLFADLNGVSALQACCVCQNNDN